MPGLFIYSTLSRYDVTTVVGGRWLRGVVLADCPFTTYDLQYPSRTGTFRVPVRERRCPVSRSRDCLGLPIGRTSRSPCLSSTTKAPVPPCRCGRLGRGEAHRAARSRAMAVRKIKGSWYVDFRWRDDRVRRLSPLNTKGGAETYEAELRQLIAQHGSIKNALAALRPKEEVRAPFFKDFVERWLTNYVDVHNRPSERRKKRLTLWRDLLPAFGKVRLDAIRAADISAFSRDQLARGLKAKTVNNRLSLLRTCLTTAIEWEELKGLPRMKFLRTPPPETKFVREEDASKLLAACPSGPWRELVLMALRTGLRFNELIALEWSAVNLETGTLQVIRGEVAGHVDAPKNNRFRTLPLTSDVVTALRSLPQVHTRVFTYQGRSLKYTNSYKHLAKFCKIAGIPHTSWHPLRHTFATHLYAKGAYLKSVQDLMGHSTINMTMRYTHVVPEVLRATVNLLDSSPKTLWAPSGQPQLQNGLQSAAMHSPDAPEFPLEQRENVTLVCDVSHGAGRGSRTPISTLAR